MIRFGIFCVWFLLSVCDGYAKEHSASSEPVEVQAPSKVSLQPGKKVEAVVTLNVKPGFHIQGNLAQPPLIPTSLVVRPKEPVSVFPAEFPPAKKFLVKPLGREVLTFEGSVPVRIPLQAKKTAKSGKRVLQARLRYQACDDTVCYPPKKATLTIPVDVQ